MRLEGLLRSQAIGVGTIIRNIPWFLVDITGARVFCRGFCFLGEEKRYLSCAIESCSGVVNDVS